MVKDLVVYLYLSACVGVAEHTIDSAAFCTPELVEKLFGITGYICCCPQFGSVGYIGCWP